MAELAVTVAALQEGRRPTAIADHRADCCLLARAWLECLDSTLHRGRARAAPPAWIAQRWPWGAPRRPLHWCEIPEAAALDCGASAAVARELWSRRSEGIVAVELVERLPAHPVASRDELRAPAGGDLAYHEAIGHVRDGRLEIWDCADCAWRRPAALGLGGPVLSLRVHGARGAVLRWGEHRVASGSWQALDAPID